MAPVVEPILGYAPDHVGWECMSGPGPREKHRVWLVDAEGVEHEAFFLIGTPAESRAAHVAELAYRVHKAFKDLAVRVAE